MPNSLIDLICEPASYNKTIRLAKRRKRKIKKLKAKFPSERVYFIAVV